MAWTAQKSRGHLNILSIQDQQFATLAGGEGGIRFRSKSEM
jgi:hypothetical protein